MQGASRPTGQPASVKIYNAVYSSVQVYECMVRGIAVMRRRADSFVNATQILKVAGVDKGRRTKILEKEILPGKHEIVQGGYGKYQGTWIPLERGRELAIQYGIAPLLSPLFDFMPGQAAMSGLPNPLPNLSALGVHRPLSATASLPSIPTPGAATNASQLGPAPIMPGSALRLLNQGRAQGLFTPSTTPAMAPSLNATSTAYQQPGLKRTRTDSELDTIRQSNGTSQMDVVMMQSSRHTSTTPDIAPNADDEPSPSKRARTEPTSNQLSPLLQTLRASHFQGRTLSVTPQSASNGLKRADSSSSVASGSKHANGIDQHPIRVSSKPPLPFSADKASPLKNSRRAAILAAICREDNANLVLNLIRDSCLEGSSAGDPIDWDMAIDDMGHTSLHIAATLARMETVKALVRAGADVHRGNLQGETPLIRAVLSTHVYDAQSFPWLLELVYPSIRTVDTANRSVLHHAALAAGVRGRAAFARYYLEGTLSWIAEQEGADFRSLVDLQDEHGDTALNIAARVGNRSLVRTLLDVGSNRILPNKLGLRPGDFGVETEELAIAPKPEDLLSTLRSAPSAPSQKSQDVIVDITSMIQKLNSDFAAEIKSKQDSFDVTQAHLRAATRELADQRRQILSWQQQCAEYDQATQRIRNIEKALVDEDSYDWSGQGKSAEQLDALGNVNDDSFTPDSNSVESLIKLRRVKAFQSQMQGSMESRLQGLHGASAEKEFQCKKIVALCTGIPFDKVEDMLENLVIAVESESQIIDIGRVSGFMQKVKDGVV